MSQKYRVEKGICVYKIIQSSGFGWISRRGAPKYSSYYDVTSALLHKKATSHYSTSYRILPDCLLGRKQKKKKEVQNMETISKSNEVNDETERVRTPRRTEIDVGSKVESVPLDAQKLAADVPQSPRRLLASSLRGDEGRSTVAEVFPRD